MTLKKWRWYKTLNMYIMPTKIVKAKGTEYFDYFEYNDEKERLRYFVNIPDDQFYGIDNRDFFGRWKLTTKIQHKMIKTAFRPKTHY
jgi:hypothetical protein